MPHGYFDFDGCRLAEEFQQVASSRRNEEFLSSFPDDVLASSLQNTWQPSATRVYRNWLQYVLSRKAAASSLVVMPDSGRARQKRSAA